MKMCIYIKNEKEGKKLNKKKKNKINKFITTAIIVFIFVLLIMCEYSMAKMVEEVIIKGKAQIAEPILTIESDPSLDITETQNYGEYTFKVKNYNEQDKLSEVDLKYYIEILSNTDDSVIIELYQGENRINLNEKKTEYMEISKNQKEEREYKIKVMYDKNKSSTFEDIMEKIQIRIHTEQEKA